MSIAICFKSYSGSSRQYAQWLAEELGGEVLKFREATPEKLAAFDTVIVISGTYATFMPLNGFLKKRWKVIKDRRVVVIAVGVIPPEDKGSQIAYNRIPAEIRDRIKYFKLPGQMKNSKTGFGKVVRENLDPIIQYLNNKV